MTVEPDPEIITTSASTGWSILLQRLTDDGPWRRLPIATWALVADAQGSPFVAAMVVGFDGQALTFAPPGTFVHESQWTRCRCSVPALEIIDRRFCTRCAGLVDVGVELEDIDP